MNQFIGDTMHASDSEPQNTLRIFQERHMIKGKNIVVALRSEWLEKETDSPYKLS